MVRTSPGPSIPTRNIETNNPKAVNMLVMGPWTHGGWAFPEYNNPSLIPFQEADQYFFQNEIEYPFFNHYLKGKGKLKLPEAWVFETGSNQWRAYESWPPEKVEGKQLFMLEKGMLSYDPPAGNQAPFDEYISDPDKPVPYTAPFMSARSLL